MRYAQEKALEEPKKEDKKKEKKEQPKAGKYSSEDLSSSKTPTFLGGNSFGR